jgi:hypothetical protein
MHASTSDVINGVRQAKVCHCGSMSTHACMQRRAGDPSAWCKHRVATLLKACGIAKKKNIKILRTYVRAAGMEMEQFIFTQAYWTVRATVFVLSYIVLPGNKNGYVCTVLHATVRVHSKRSLIRPAAFSFRSYVLLLMNRFVEQEQHRSTPRSETSRKAVDTVERSTFLSTHLPSFKRRYLVTQLVWQTRGKREFSVLGSVGTYVDHNGRRSRRGNKGMYNARFLTRRLQRKKIRAL